MKLGILLYPSSKPVRHQVAYTWEDILRHNRRSLDYRISRRFFNSIELLSRNPRFEKTILDLRKKYGIPPAGLQINDFLAALDADRRHAAPGVPKDLYSSFHSEASRIYETHDLILGLQINEIVEYGVVDPMLMEPEDVRVAIHDKDIDGDIYEEGDTATQVSIDILAPVSKNYLLKYITANWNHIEKGMRKLSPSTSHPPVSKRDLEVFDLRTNRNLSFHLIADKIIKKYGADDAEAAINDDSMKTAYSRTKKAIDAMFSPIPKHKR